jgi:hypothetical protein
MDDGATPESEGCVPLEMSSGDVEDSHDEELAACVGGSQDCDGKGSGLDANQGCVDVTSADR